MGLTARELNVSIGELHLEGIGERQRYVVGDSLSAELTRLFTERGTPPAFESARAVEGLSLSIELGADSGPAAIGRSLAGAIYAGLAT